MAKSHLEAEGIDAMVQADTDGGMQEHLAWSGAGFRLLVRAEDEAAAKEVLSVRLGSLVIRPHRLRRSKARRND